MTVDLQKYLTEMESVPCSACSSSDTLTVSTRDKYGLDLDTVFCNHCSLLYINPRPSKRQYSSLNKADYRLAAIGTDSGLDSIFRKQYQHANHTIIPFIKPFFTNSPESLLDIGCCNGGTISAIKEQYSAINCLGIEPVIKVADDAANRTQCEIQQILFEDYVPSNKFDLIIFAQALNHTLDPLKNLQKVVSLLSDRGLLFISLFDAVSTLCTRPPAKMAEIMHPYMFGHESLNFIMQKAGLSPLATRGQPLNGQMLKPWHIPSILSPRIQIVAEKNKTGDTPPLPDCSAVLQRLHNNMEFYHQYKRQISFWRQPRFFPKNIVKLATISK